MERKSDERTFGPREDQPIILEDLARAASALDDILYCARNFIPSEEEEGFANEIRQHLIAAAKIIHAYAERHAERLAQLSEQGTGPMVFFGREDLRYHLTGRRSIGPGNPLSIHPSDLWKRYRCWEQTVKKSAV